MGFDKESIYDDKLNPLVAQIVEICKNEGIPFAMTFGIKEEEDNSLLYCTTYMYGQENSTKIDVDHFKKLASMMMNPNPSFIAAFTVEKE